MVEYRGSRVLVVDKAMASRSQCSCPSSSVHCHLRRRLESPSSPVPDLNSSVPTCENRPVVLAGPSSPTPHVSQHGTYRRQEERKGYHDPRRRGTSSVAPRLVLPSSRSPARSQSPRPSSTCTRLRPPSCPTPSKLSSSRPSPARTCSSSAPRGEQKPSSVRLTLPHADTTSSSPPIPLPTPLNSILPLPVPPSQ